MKNLAEHWDLPNIGISYSKDVASECGILMRNSSSFESTKPSKQKYYVALYRTFSMWLRLHNAGSGGKDEILRNRRLLD
jgi:hypothetical protein